MTDMNPVKSWKRYLLWFANEHVDFRFPEIQSLVTSLNIEMRWAEEPIDSEVYWIVDFPTEDCARLLCSRAISVRWCVELWAKAPSLMDLQSRLKEALNNNAETWTPRHSCPRDIMQPYFCKDKTFKINVETFCKHFTLQEKVKKIETFSFLPLEGSIRLKEPDTELMYLEHYGLDPSDIPDKPHHLFFGRLVCEGQRQLISKLSLKKRKFIGNTSMDAQLSVLMANQAQVLPGQLVLDPFVGSGSLLVAAAHFGGYVLGTDIDFLMIHGRTRPSRVTQKVREKDENIKANMRQYEIQDKYIDVLVTDFSLPLWRDSLRLDAIITDPPYGIREPTEKIGINKENYTLAEEHLGNHVPAKIDYQLTTIFTDLLAFAAKHLTLGRRLVCWLPFYREDYNEDIIPKHECLQLLYNSEQILSKLTARRLLTYQKISEPFVNTNQSIDPLIVTSDENNAVDFRQKYFFSGEQTRKERKEIRAQEKERGKIQKELRLQREMAANRGTNIVLHSSCTGGL